MKFTRTLTIVSLAACFALTSGCSNFENGGNASTSPSPTPTLQESATALLETTAQSAAATLAVDYLAHGTKHRL